MPSDNVIKFERLDPPPEVDFDSEMAMYDCREMLRYVLDPRMPSSVQQACVVSLLINLNDLLNRARTIGKGISFTDHIDQLDGVNDITDLVSKCRNAACHIRSPLRQLGQSTFVFNRIEGYAPRAFQIGELVVGCDFPDDVAVYYGVYRIYLRRHVVRALDELDGIFPSHLR